jgi:hypothetical protein
MAARWDDLGLTHEQFLCVVEKFTPNTPNEVVNWWFRGDCVLKTPPKETRRLFDGYIEINFN